MLLNITPPYTSKLAQATLYVVWWTGYGVFGRELYCAQVLSGALRTAEAQIDEQAGRLLEAESRERQAATDAEAARSVILEARAEIGKLTTDAASDKQAAEVTIRNLQRSYDEAAAAQESAERSLRSRDEEITQLHTLLQGAMSFFNDSCVMPFQ